MKIRLKKTALLLVLSMVMVMPSTIMAETVTDPSKDPQPPVEETKPEAPQPTLLINGGESEYIAGQDIILKGILTYPKGYEAKGEPTYTWTVNGEETIKATKEDAVITT